MIKFHDCNTYWKTRMNVEEERQRHALIDEEPMLEKESACKSVSANISQRGLHVPCFSNEEPSPSFMPSNTSRKNTLRKKEWLSW